MYKKLKSELQSLKEKQILKRKQVIYIAASLIFVLCFMVYKLVKSRADAPAFEVPVVTVSKAELGPVVRYVNAIGTLRPYDSVQIKSEVNSIISNIYFSEGAVVEEGSLLLELDDSSAKTALMEAEAQYRKSKSEFEPSEKLALKGVLAKVQMDKSKADLDMSEAKMLSCRENLKKHKIYAPFKGTVGLKEISRGQYVAPGTELLKLVDCHLMKVDFKVSESDVNNVHVGQSIKIFVGGNDSQAFDASIIAIDPESDKISHSFDVRALLDFDDTTTSNSRVLKPGRFVSVKVAIGGDQKGVLVPEGALEKIGEDDMLYKVSDGIAIRTMVKTGMRRDGNVEIIDGVNEGDLIITSGQQSVLDGREVQIRNDDGTISNIGGKISEFYKEKLGAVPKKKQEILDPRKSIKLMEKRLEEMEKTLKEKKNRTEEEEKRLKSIQGLKKIINERKKKFQIPVGSTNDSSEASSTYSNEKIVKENVKQDDSKDKASPSVEKEQLSVELVKGKSEKDTNRSEKISVSLLSDAKSKSVDEQSK